MPITVLGVNHKTAPVELREKIAFSNEIINKALYSLYQHPLVDGCLILSTYNRSEIYLSYACESELPKLKLAVLQWLAQFHHIAIVEFNQSLYWHDGRAAVEHIMCVASGLDSLIIGEPQILGQVKQAYEFAHNNHTLSH